MPKVKRIRSAALAGQESRHAPLGQVIQDDENRGKYAALRHYRTKSGKRYNWEPHIQDDAEGGEEEPLLDERTSRKIFELSREQQLEIEAEQSKASRPNARNIKQHQQEEDDEEEAAWDDDNIQEEDDFIQHESGYVTLVEGAEGLTADEEAVFASISGSIQHRKTLADIIMDKINEKEALDRGEMQSEEYGIDLPPKVVDVYTEIGQILSRYTSGKLPKAFKVIPSLANWEQVLYLTRPDMWTPQAMFAATRIFASNLNPKMAQRFYNLVLLDSVRADIYANKKLNYHYYVSLKKAVYKPAAFFKGILLPLCKENCTLREAAIVASVLQRVSIPSHHSAVALHKLAQLSYSGAASIFIKTLLNKKYSLPVPVIASLVAHFSAFVHDQRVLPVLWHQSFLVFAQRYKNELKGSARDSLRAVMKKHFHPKITPEIRRELFGAQAWRDERKTTT